MNNTTLGSFISSGILGWWWDGFSGEAVAVILCAVVYFKVLKGE